MNDRIEQSRKLHARARAMIASYEAGRPMPEPFDALAADLARFQAENVPGYGRLCAARGIDPRALPRPSEAPAVPADAFKLSRVFAFEEQDARAVFRTSGTTIGARGLHFVRDLGTYDAGALAFGRVMLARGLPRTVAVAVLGPSEKDAPDSSLAHMCALFVREFGGPQGEGDVHFVRGPARARGTASIALDALRARMAEMAPGGAAVVLATSLALVHLLEAAGGAAIPLPKGSRVMQTGGFKGRAREVSAADLRRDVARFFGIGERAVTAEYGMTELSSQFWEGTTADDRAEPGVYLEPPWARVVPVHPESLVPLAPGQAGLARIEDLANVDSAWAVLTHDLVRRTGAGFELLGRAGGAPPRGCSVALDEMLGTPR